MRAKIMAALHVALCLLLFTMIAHAEVGANNFIEKSDLISTEDFIEYASINDVNIHELYFGTILYEGTES